MIIDMHTHTFPDKIAEATIAHMEQEIVTKRGYEVKSKVAGTRNALSRSTKENGIDLSVVVPVATKPEQSASINRFALKTNESTEETRVFSFGAIHPDNTDYKEILNDVKAMGLKGIKLHPDYQGVEFDDERYVRIMDYAANLGLIIVTHAGEDIGLPEKIHCTPDMVLHVLDRIQPEKLVLAHMGGWNMWDEVEEKLVGKQVYLDTAFVFEKETSHMEKEQFLRMVSRHGADRILFATDSPWSDQGQSVRHIRQMGLKEPEESRILGENAAGLLGLSSLPV
ncbi:MAG: amidohydrolase family protein [Lachnospiraceae bacterium]|nr:amidohydrolase family protein [Lachnospiraceae bacterium]